MFQLSQSIKVIGVQFCTRDQINKFQNYHSNLEFWKPHIIIDISDPENNHYILSRFPSVKKKKKKKPNNGKKINSALLGIPQKKWKPPPGADFVFWIKQTVLEL